MSKVKSVTVTLDLVRGGSVEGTYTLVAHTPDVAHSVAVIRDIDGVEFQARAVVKVVTA